MRLVVAAVLALAPVLGHADGGLRISGYYKALGTSSRTADGERRRQLLQRLRLKLDAAPAPQLDLHLENDFQWRLGRGADGTRPGLRNRVYRAHAKYSLRNTDFWLGRQRIVLGTGRMWSTIDMLNPVNPLQVERDEYIGVDALRAEQRLGALSSLSAVYARAKGGGTPRWVGRWRTHAAGADVGVNLAQYWNDRLYGVDLATQVQGLGLRGELTGTHPQSGRRYVSALLGADYAFTNTLTLSFESYWSTQDAAERQAQFAAEPLRMRVQPPGTRYAGVMASYEFTPLVKGTVTWMSQLRDHSDFASATLNWSLHDNLLLQAGTQVFMGERDTEFGRGRGLSHVQVQWFF